MGACVYIVCCWFNLCEHILQARQFWVLGVECPQET